MATVKKTYTDADGRSFTSIKYFKPALDTDTCEYRLKSRTQGYIMRTDVPYPEGMKPLDIGYINILAKHSVCRIGLLAHVVNRRMISLSVDDMINVLGLSHKRGMMFIKRMQRFKMLRRVDLFDDDKKMCRQWYLSPVYFTCIVINSLTYMIWHKEIAFELPAYVNEFFAARVTGKNIKSIE